jgi:hypothetical protein
LKKYMYSLGKNNINTCGSLKISQKLLGWFWCGLYIWKEVGDIVEKMMMIAKYCDYVINCLKKP